MYNEIVKESNIQPKIKYIVDQFVSMKKSLYDISDEEFNLKTTNLVKNIADVKIKDKKEDYWGAGYDTKNKTIYLSNDIYQNFLKKKTDNKDVLLIMHELSHIWDYLQKNKTTGIINNRKANKKYKYLNEAINEAKTMILTLNAKTDFNNKGNLATSFQSYNILQSVFDRLYVVSGMQRLDFLKAIEGKKIDEIASILSNKTGNNLERSKEYIDTLADSSTFIVNNFVKSKNKKRSKNKRKDSLKNIFSEHDFLNKQSIDFLNSSHLKNNNKIHLKLKYIAEHLDKAKQKTVCFNDIKEDVNYSGIVMDFVKIVADVNEINEIPEVEYGIINKIQQVSTRLFNKNKVLDEKNEKDIVDFDIKNELKESINSNINVINYDKREPKINEKEDLKEL